MQIDSASYRNEAIEEFVKEIQTEASKEQLEQDLKYKLEKSTKKSPTKEGKFYAVSPCVSIWSAIMYGPLPLFEIRVIVWQFSNS